MRILVWIALGIFLVVAWYLIICFVLISISALQGSMISFSIYLFILFATFIYVRKLEILN